MTSRLPQSAIQEGTSTGVHRGYRRCTAGATMLAGGHMAIRTTRSVGMMLLAIWLILTGIQTFVSLPVPAALSAALALIAGVLILLGI